jgi:hypothetical protein
MLVTNEELESPLRDLYINWMASLILAQDKRWRRA